jgi:hypothetical protein
MAERYGHSVLSVTVVGAPAPMDLSQLSRSSEEMSPDGVVVGGVVAMSVS